MTIAVATVDYRSEDVWGSAKVRLVDVTFDASYAAGGETITPASVALAEIIGASVIGNPSGYAIAYNQVTGKLVVRGQEPTDLGTGVLELDEETAATNLSGLTVRLLVIGR